VNVMAEERTIVARFDDARTAEDAVERLVRAGVPERVLQLAKPDEPADGRTHAVVIARVPHAAAPDLAQALTELGASGVDHREPPVAPPVPARDVMFESFTETVFELPEFTEQAVTVKRPWVVEEVVLAKVVRERTEAVRDTLQRRDVAVDDLTPAH
jgi:hypothetical protein